MHVVKRDGRTESVHFDKITSRIDKLAFGLDTKVRNNIYLYADSKDHANSLEGANN